MANLYDKAGLVNIPVGYQDGFLYNIKPEDNTLGFRFNRDSAATRVNKEGLIEQVGYFGPELVQNGDFSQLGPELVVNGGFETDSSWNKAAGWSIGGGSASCDGSQTSASYLSQGLSGVSQGKQYITKFDIIVVSGTFRFNTLGGNLVVTESGSYTINSTSVSGTSLFLEAFSDFIGSIDNVSVKEVGQDWNFVGESELTSEGIRIYSSTGSLSQVSQSNVMTVGKQYKLQYEVISTNGINLRDSSDSIVYDTSTLGQKTKYFESIGTSLEFKRNGVTDVTITNISVKEVLGDKPRIDYTDSLTSPSFLLEPQSTNLITYSEDFSQWASSNLTLTSSQSSAITASNDAWLFTATGTLANISLAVSSSGANTFSVFAKSGTQDGIFIRFSGGSSPRAFFNLSNGTLISSSSITSSSVEAFNDGWYRISITGTDNVTDARIYVADSTGNFVSSGNIYVQNAQLEQQSYLTSYISTAGSTVTRTQETCNGAGSASAFNSSEGVLYVEIAALTDLGSYRLISLNSNNSPSNRITIAYDNVNNQIYGQCVAGGTSQALFTTQPTSISDFHKIALKYKANDLAFWVDGVEVGTDTSASIPTSLNTLSFNRADAASFFYGKTKGVYVFNEALTDDELQQLTGPEYNSFAALAAAYNYTVI